MVPLTAAPRPACAPSGAQRRLHVLGDTLDVLLSREDTGGEFSLLMMHNPASAHAPDHLHEDATESFHVLEGTYDFTVNGVTRRATPGASLFVPRGAVHSFRVVGGRPAKALVVTTPGGIEQFHEAVEALAISGPITPAALADAGARHGMRLLPPRDLARP